MLRLLRLLELAFHLLLPLLFLACLENSSVRWNPALAGVAVGRLVTGPTDELRSDPGGGLLLLNALLVVGGDAIALPQIRLRKTELTSLSPRSRRAHGGAHAGGRSSRDYDRSPRPGTSWSYAKEDRYQSGAGRRFPGPSGAADDDRFLVPSSR